MCSEVLHTSMHGGPTVPLDLSSNIWPWPHSTFFSPSWSEFFHPASSSRAWLHLLCIFWWSIWRGHISPEPSLKVDRQLSQPVLVSMHCAPAFWPSPDSPALCLLQYVWGFFLLEGPRLDWVVRQSHKCRVERKDHVPGPTGYTLMNAELQNAECRPAFLQSCPLDSLPSGCTSVGGYSVPDIGLHICSFWTPWDSGHPISPTCLGPPEQQPCSPADKLLPTISGHSQTCWLCTLVLSLRSVMKSLNSTVPENPRGTLIITGLQLNFAELITSLSLAVQTIFHPFYCSLIQPVFHQSDDNKTVEDWVKSFAEVEEYNKHWPLLVHSASHLVIEKNHVGEAWLPSMNSRRLFLPLLLGFKNGI